MRELRVWGGINMGKGVYNFGSLVDVDTCVRSRCDAALIYLNMSYCKNSHGNAISCERSVKESG